MKSLVVDRVKVPSAELEEALGRLLPQLSARLAAPGEERLRRLLAHPTTALFVARGAEEGAEERARRTEGVRGVEGMRGIEDASGADGVAEEVSDLAAGRATAAEPADAAGPVEADLPAGCGRIVGILTLVWYDAPSGRKAWIEDVVVDAAARGCGAGRALVEAAQRLSREIGADRLMLTSNPRRTAARALYRKCGFNEAETTVFVAKTDRE